MVVRKGRGAREGQQQCHGRLGTPDPPRSCPAPPGTHGALPTPPLPHEQSLPGSSPGSTLDCAWHFHGWRALKTALRCTQQCKRSLGRCCGDQGAGPCGTRHQHQQTARACPESFSRPSEPEVGTDGTHSVGHSTRHPSPDTLHRTGKWGPVGGMRPPVARQCQHPGQMWRGHQPHRQGPEPAPYGNLCPPGPSRAHPQPRGVRDMKREQASRKDSASRLLGLPNKAELPVWGSLGRWHLIHRRLLRSTLTNSEELFVWVPLHTAALSSQSAPSGVSGRQLPLFGRQSFLQRQKQATGARLRVTGVCVPDREHTTSEETQKTKG